MTLAPAIIVDKARGSRRRAPGPGAAVRHFIWFTASPTTSPLEGVVLGVVPAQRFAPVERDLPGWGGRFACFAGLDRRPSHLSV